MREYPESFRRPVLAALRAAPYSVSAIAPAYGIHHSTVTRWARQAGVVLPHPAERIAGGGLEGARRRWGDFERRHRQARKLRAKGMPLKQIAKRKKGRRDRWGSGGSGRWGRP